MSSSSFFISEVFIDEVNDRLDDYLDNIFNLTTNLLNEDPDLIAIAETYIKEWCKVPVVPYLLIKLALTIWRINNENFPSLDKIVDHFNQNPCECSADMNDDDRKAMIRMCLISSGSVPPCDFTVAFRLYVREYNAIPTYATMQSILNRMNNILYSSLFDEKVKEGTKNIEHIPVYTCSQDKEYDCSLCMDKITAGQKYHQLQPCGHHFHATSDECIDSTIVKWLSENQTCPNCRKDVYISVPENSSVSSVETS